MIDRSILNSIIVISRLDRTDKQPLTESPTWQAVVTEQPGERGSEED
jgi:hypothetical protein